jgi:hypothetical protein
VDPLHLILQEEIIHQQCYHAGRAGNANGLSLQKTHVTF